MKTVLFLGASRHQIPPIEYAKSKGYKTICCDYTPNAPGFSIADMGYTTSTTDLDGILDIAKKEAIDGIVAYASDPAASTAAYVAEKLGLPGNPYDSVKILTHKHLYRAFLHKHDFASPKTYEYGDVLSFPCVVKPVDSSGSKGISVIKNESELNAALELAAKFSRCGKIIAEEYIARDGRQIAGDGFVIDGKLAFCGFANEHFDIGGIVPVGESFPYTLPTDDVRSEIQRLIDILCIRNGALNFDIVLQGGKVYLMEIGPRNGGCLIPDVIKHQCGIDLIAATVESALGHTVRLGEAQNNGLFSSCMIHADRDGKFERLIIDSSMQVIQADVWVNKGDEVRSYTGSDCTIGHAILKWDNYREMVEKMDNIKEYMKVIVE